MQIKIHSFHLTCLTMLLLLSGVLAGCSTTHSIGKTIWYSGKDVEEVFEEEGYPDDAYLCVKDNVIRYIYVYNRGIYEWKQYYVGTDGYTDYYQNQKEYVGMTQSYIFTNENNIVTSIRNASGFGNLEKEFGCNQYMEELYSQNILK